MNQKAKTLDVTIMGRTYKVACSDEERNALLSAVAYLDRKMTEIKNAGRVGSAERIAVMAALNIAHDLLRAKRNARSEAAGGESSIDGAAARRRIQSMQAVIDQTMAGQEKLF